MEDPTKSTIQEADPAMVMRIHETLRWLAATAPRLVRRAPVRAPHTRAAHTRTPPGRLAVLLVTHAAILLFLAACGGTPSGPENDPEDPEPPVRYVIDVSGEEFVAEVATETQMEGLEARLESGERGVIFGQLEGGSASYNEPWSWHMDPSTVRAVDVAIEVCDGRPSGVEADLTYWLETVGSFCPWNARVVRRLSD